MFQVTNTVLLQVKNAYFHAFFLQNAAYFVVNYFLHHTNRFTMLPKQLFALKQHLIKLSLSGVPLSRQQQQLLQELRFMEGSATIKREFDVNKIKLESFTVDPAVCPNCGKKY